MKKLRRIIQAVEFSCFFAIFAGNPTAYAAPKIPQELRDMSMVFCTGVSGFSFNPQKADIGTNMNVVTEQIYDKLLEFDPKTNQLTPALAEKYTVSDDGKTITLHLRRKVSFHDTEWFTPTRYLNAEDVVFSLNRMIGNTDELPALNLGDDNQGVFQQNQRHAYQYKANLAHYPYFESVALKDKIERISAPDDYTVKIRLVEPDSAILAHLASQFAVILSKEYALSLNADENLAQLDLLPVGTGVYRLNDYTSNEYIRLSPHPKYWGKKAYIENMVVDISNNSSGRMAKYLNGECDVIALPEPSQHSVLNAKEVIKNEGANLAFLAFNTQRPQMQDAAFRSYISRSINRKRLAEILFYGEAEVADNVLPTILFPEQNPTGYPYSPGKETGDKKAKTNHRLNFWVLDEKRIYNLHPLKMAEMIRADLEKIGIEVNIRPVSRSYVVRMAEIGKADYDLILTGWIANNADPNAFLSSILSCRSQNEVTNLANWCHEEFDYWLETAKLSEQASSRILIYKLVQKILEEEMPILPLVNGNRLLFVHENVANAQISPFGQVKLSDLKFKEKK